MSNLYSSNTGFAFLKIPSTAKSIGLAGIKTTISEDANTVFLNQSRLAYLNNNNISFNTISFFDDITIFNLSYASEGKYFNHGFGIKNLQKLSIERTRIEGQSPITNLGTADYYDRQIMYAISRKINASSSVGMGISYYSQKLDNMERNTFLVDLGYSKDYSDNLRFGVSVKNLGQSFSYYKEKTNIPYHFSAGMYYKHDIILHLLADLNYFKNEDIYLSLGTIINFEEYVEFYVGWQTNNDIKNSINLGLSILGNNFKLTYSYKNYDYFGDLHSFNLSIYFDKREKRIKPEPEPKEIITVSKEDLYFKLVRTGQKLFENKNYTEAILYYKKAVEIKPNFNIGIYRRIADTYFLLKKYSEAENYYNIYRKKLENR